MWQVARGVQRCRGVAQGFQVRGGRKGEKSKGPQLCVYSFLLHTRLQRATEEGVRGADSKDKRKTDCTGWEAGLPPAPAAPPPPQEVKAHNRLAAAPRAMRFFLSASSFSSGRSRRNYVKQCF